MLTEESIEQLNKELWRILHSEDAIQNVWLEAIENNIQDIDGVRSIALTKHHRKYELPHSSLDATFIDRSYRGADDRNLYDVIPCLPLEPFPDGGFTEEITSLVAQSTKHRKIFYICRTTDTQCKYCKSEQVVRDGNCYSRAKGLENRKLLNQYYLCRCCNRRFKDGTYYHHRFPVTQIEWARQKREEGLSERNIGKLFVVTFNINPSRATIHNWIKDNPNRQQALAFIDKIK